LYLTVYFPPSAVVTVSPTFAAPSSLEPEVNAAKKEALSVKVLDPRV
jgi:hypothetical protein